jgi:putative membrane protein
MNRLIATVAACTVVLAACKSKSDDTTSATDTTKAAAATPSSTTPSSESGAVANTDTLTDANILAKARIGDSAEVAIADYMLSMSKSPGVKSYANLLKTDHGKGMKEVDDLSKKTSLTPQLPSNDTTSQETSHVLDHLKSLSGSDRDTAFVNHEIDDHQHDIADAKQMEAAAKNSDLKVMLQKELPELQKHLDKAQALARKKPN